MLQLPFSANSLLDVSRGHIIQWSVARLVLFAFWQEERFFVTQLCRGGWEERLMDYANRL